MALFKWFQYQAKTDPIWPASLPQGATAPPSVNLPSPITVHSRTQYQAKAEGFLPPSGVPLIEHIAISIPVREQIARGLAIALIASGGVLGQPASDVTGIKYTALSEPVRTAPRDAWFQPYTIGVPDATDVTGIKYTPLSEPVRVPPRDAWFQFAPTLGQPASDVTGVQYLALSEPVRVKPIAPWFQFAAYTESAPFAEEVSEDRWHQPWSEPVRVAPRAAWFQPATSFAPNPVVSFSYYNWLADPVRTAPRATWFQFAPTLGQPASDVTGLQYPPLSEPVRALPRTAWYQDRAYVEIAPFPEEVSEDRWHQPWSEPVRVPPRLFDASQQFYAANIFPILNFSVISSQWFAPLTDPVRLVPRTAWFQSDTLVQFSPFAEEVSEDRWHQPWSEPVRFAPRATWFQFSAYTESAPFAEEISEDRWHQPWSEPVRTKPRLLDAAQQFLALNPQPFVSFSYYLPLTEPVVKSLPRSAWFQFQAYTESAPFPEEVSEDRWHQPWTEPVRVRPRAAYFQEFAGLGQPIVNVFDIKWFAPLSDPVRLPLRTTWFQADTLTRTASDVTGIKYTPLAEPVRLPPRAVWFQPETESLNPVVSFAYFRALTDPVRLPPSFRIGTELFNSMPRPFVPIEPAGFRGWYNWLTEPVRLPIGLKAYLQSTTVIPPRIISLLTSGTMSTTELGDALLAGLIAFNQVASAEVGIIDQPPTSGEVGLIEITQVSASVGSTVNVAANQSGTVVTSGISARVSIRII